MDAKKTLVELANDVLQYLPWGEIQKDTAEQIADRMIDHGVTVQEWISVKDRLPEFGRRVLILGNRKDGQFIYIDQICADGNWLLVNWEVTHWMPLPQPPKGEEKDGR